MRVLFVAGFGPIAREDTPVGDFYESVLGIPFEHEGRYLHTGALSGVNHYAVWPLDQAAESCFGVPIWPSEVPVPHAWIEFDVDDVQQATDELRNQGYELLVSNRQEPWGQVVTRLLAPDNLLVGLTYTPWMRK